MMIEMFRKKHKKRKTISKWSDQDRQNFADRNILKSYKIPSKKKSPPDKNEWD
jgi:hypothetical protein